MPFFRDLIKDIIREDLEAGQTETPAVKTETGTDPENSPKQPQEATSNTNDDKNTTPNADTAKQGADEAKTATKETPDQFNVELRKMIKREVRDYAADQLNKEASKGAAAVNVDDAFCHLLGFPTQQKGGK